MSAQPNVMFSNLRTETARAIISITDIANKINVRLVSHGKVSHKLSWGVGVITPSRFRQFRSIYSTRKVRGAGVFRRTRKHKEALVKRTRQLLRKRIALVEAASLLLGLPLLAQQLFMHYMANLIIQLQEIIQRLMHYGVENGDLPVSSNGELERANIPIWAAAYGRGCPNPAPDTFHAAPLSGAARRDWKKSTFYLCIAM